MTLREHISGRMAGIHMAGWLLAYGMFFVYGYYLGQPTPLPYLMAFLLSGLLCSLILFYTFYAVLVPSYLEERRWHIFVPAALLIVAAIAVLRYGIRPEVVMEVAPQYQFSLDRLDFWAQLPARVILYALLALFSIMIRITFDWFRYQELSYRLSRRARQQERELLRMQMKPHFLFNSLNNLYTLARRDGKKAAEGILALSRLMRYVTGIHGTSSISLEREVRFLENYLDLQSLRYARRGVVRFRNLCEDADFPLPPMLLIPLVENAFKHGRIDVCHPLEIDLVCRGKRMEFRVENCLRNAQSCTATSGDGVGLSNLRRRLELLNEGSYSLEINREGNSHMVKLILLR